VREETDVLVVGGGPAGAAAAMTCTQRGLRTILVEARATARRRLGESLSPFARKPLEDLGLLSEFLTQGHTPTYFLRSSWGGSVVERDSIRHGRGPDHHLDRARFDEWLLVRAQQRRVRVLRPVLGLRLVREDRHRFVARADWCGAAIEVRARAVIDATGRSAFAMRQLGARVTRTDRLLGLARWFERRACQAMLLVETTSEGWWYSAPTPQAGQVAVFFTDRSPETRRSSWADVWQTALDRAALTSELLQNPHPGPVEVYPASPQVTEYAPDGPYLPVGDAAFAADPIGGGGLVLALSSGSEAARALDLHFRGSPAVLRSYREGVHRLFARHLVEREAAYASERAVRPWSDFWRRHRNPSDGSVPTS
jgi:flavin-dependent dehydrogenase